MADALDDLHAATATPVTARRPWLQTWLCCFHHDPLIVAVWSGDRLEAVALLAQHRRFGLTETVAMGNGPSDRVAFPSRGPEASAALSRRLAAHLLGQSGHWRLAVSHLPANDPVALALAAALPQATLVAGDTSPALRFGPDRRLRSYVSRNHHQQVRQAVNRMRRQGLTPEFEHLRDPAAIAAVLPQVEEVCRRRDAMLHRPSQLDDPRDGPFFRSVILDHAGRGEVDLTILRLNGELAAYCLCFVDNGSYRMWNCRFAPAWGHLSPGRVANNEAIQHALADPGCSEFDWMLGDESYKSGLQNHVDTSQNLLAWSSAPVRAVLDAPRAVLQTLKEVKDRHESLERAWENAKRARERIRSRARQGAWRRPTRP
jgi:CelD/BcsL family acetyltransferase involved in cellulose biosynthesis